MILKGFVEAPANIWPIFDLQNPGEGAVAAGADRWAKAGAASSAQYHCAQSASTRGPATAQTSP